MDESNLLIDIYNNYKSLVKNDIINDFKLKYDGKNKVLHINVVPKQILEHINVNFTITKNGSKFDPSM